VCECGIVSNHYSKNKKIGYHRGVALTTAEPLPPTTLSPHRIAYATQVKHASTDFVLRWACLTGYATANKDKKRVSRKECKRTTQPETLKGISWCLVSILALSKNETRVRSRFGF